MRLIHELIEANAAVSPDKPAISDETGALSYADLVARTAVVAGALARMGVATGKVVAVYVPLSNNVLVGAVGALRTGAIFVPFDVDYPIERLSYMLSDSETMAIVTTRSQWERKPLAFDEGRVVFVDEVAPSTDVDFSDCHELTGDSPAMLLYTSGTTGNPKGVLHTHKTLPRIAHFLEAHDGLSMGANSRSAIMTSVSFVGTALVLWAPVAAGGTVCIVAEMAKRDMGELYRFIREQRITHIFMLSSLGAIMAEDFDLAGVIVLAAGEKLRPFHAASDGNFLVNTYGSTEMSAVLSKRLHGNESRMLVGTCAPGDRAIVVDDELRELADGEVGELLFSGDYMSRQYWKLPELTGRKWVERDGLLWFRTGDRAVRTPEGDFDILGRVDNMVKLRGFRIETGEVEVQVARATEALGRTDVRQVAVVLREVGGTDHLTCYYEAPTDLDTEAVMAEAARSLASYMVPDVWVRMDEFPKNANGKVIRAQLPQPQPMAHVIGALDSEVVGRLVWTVADVLGITGFISPDDRFTDLGGTSLTAMQLVVALRKQGIKIGGVDILRLNVLRKIADAAQVAYEQLWSPREYEEVRADFAGRNERIERVMPITAVQDDLLFMQLLHPDVRPLRNIWFLQVDSEIAEAHLREALDVVSSEHEELRAAIVYHNVQVVQQVISDRRIPLEMVDATSLDASGMAELRRDILASRIDLQRDGLMRVIGLTDTRRRMLCVVAHKIAFDEVQVRGYLARLMGLLEAHYPDDVSIHDWRELFEMAEAQDEATGTHDTKRQRAFDVSSAVPPEVCVYSENAGPKVVFVHTGNTGSAAYYQLAARIADEVSFSVIEPYNLYHPDSAVYGIKNIAANYVRILRRHQPAGPYILGGWCYGGMVAHEMACQLQAAGETVTHLFMLDSHAVDSEELRRESQTLNTEVNREYFETSPLFAELRESGMLEAMVTNAHHVIEDMTSHTPSFFHGATTYFKPAQIPTGLDAEGRKYWETMMEFEAGNYEKYCERTRLEIVHTPHEHDLMMDGPSLDIIVPKMLSDIRGAQSGGVTGRD